MGRWVLGDGLSDQRLLNRYKKRFTPDPAPLDRLAEAIHQLHQSGGEGDPFFLARCLELLAKQVDSSQATLVMVSGSSVESRWWYPELAEDQAPAPVPSFCEWLLENPERILAVGDIETCPHTRNLADLRSVPYRAVLGCAVRHAEGVRALLFAFFDQRRDFPRMEYALIESVAGFIGRVLEVEDLKHSLHRLEDALAITQAVMEDSSTCDPETDLPNLRYLEIWQKAMLGSEHRPDSLVVAEFKLDVRTRKDAGRIRKAAEGVRAGDLVVRTAPGRFLMIFQHTPRSIAHVMLLRMRSQLGGVPMGATLWIPGKEGRGLESCQPLLDAALEESRTMALPTLVWNLPEGAVEGSASRQRLGTVKTGVPQRWEPPLLGGS